MNEELLRGCAKRGVRAAFVASGGYGEAGPEGRALEARLVATAEELGMVVAGPNGQGVISTAESMCAQIVAPYPPPGQDRRREPEREPRLELPELRVPHRHRRLEGDLGGQLGAARRGGLPRVLRRRPVDGGGARLSRGRARRAPAAPRAGAPHGAQAPRAREGRRGRGGPARGREPHRIARQRRPRVRRALPAGRRAARAERRARLRVGGQLRDPAAAARAAERRVHDRGRLGRARGGRLRGGGPRADPPARGPAAARSTALVPPRWSRSNPWTSPAARRATRSPRCST